MAIVILAIVGIITLAWLYLRHKHQFFESRGVHTLPPTPILGNMTRVILRKEHLTEAQEKLYHAFPNDKFVGTYEFLTPQLVIRDPEILKKVMLKDFDHFNVRRIFAVQEDDPFLSKSLVALRGQRWRDMRSTLSPAFTGSKLRAMVPFMRECSKTLFDNLRQEMEKSDGVMDFNAKDLCSRYATDVIATCAFGLKVDSLKEKDNDFHKAGKELTTLKLSAILKTMFLGMLPFAKKKKSDVGSSSAVSFLRQVILSTMKAREQNQITRPDMIQLLIEAKKGTLKHEDIKDEKDAGFATVEESEIGKGAIAQEWSDEDLFSQTLLFYIAGFETVSTAMSFTLHELAINPDVQKKLQEEVDHAWSETKGNIDYNKLNELKYLDMVISETLRKWPPSNAGFRTCTKKYNLGKPYAGAKSDYIVDVNQLLVIPTWALHRDPQHYPEPDKFDPERFSDDNKHNVKPFTYLPFGLGPRNCIGSRFALTELKTMTYDLVRTMEVLPGPTTSRTGQLDRSAYRTALVGGHDLKLRLRKH